jgi:hypothetical protein
MLKQILTQKPKSRAIHCTKGTLLSPNTRLSPAVSHSILLKTRTPQNEGRTTNQKAGSSNLSGRTILTSFLFIFILGIAVRERFRSALV